MKAPDNYMGMKKVKEYNNFALYVDKNGIRECFQYWDLGHTELDKIKIGRRNSWAY